MGLNINMQKNESRHRTYILNKKNLKMDHRLNCKMRIIAFLEEQRQT